MADKIAVLFGGRSGEHEVSLVSGLAVAKALLESSKEVHLYGISKKNTWHTLDPKYLELDANQARSLVVQSCSAEIDPFKDFSKKGIEVVFPVLHGPYGEDGILQGFIEMLGYPYVGCGVLASSVAMDKDVSKKLFGISGVPVLDAIVLHRHEHSNSSTLFQKIQKQFDFPFFVKPCNMGSSVGISKIKSQNDLEGALQKAFAFDTKVLIEKGIDARELEVSVLGNRDPKCSIIGEICPKHEFYSYEAKYLDENGAELVIPAKDISDNERDEIHRLAKLAFKTLGASGLLRADFFMCKKSRQIYLNEVNTMPGFTPISMYPKLWEASGLSFRELTLRLVDLAAERYIERSSIKTDFKT